MVEVKGSEGVKRRKREWRSGKKVAGTRVCVVAACGVPEIGASYTRQCTQCA